MPLIQTYQSGQTDKRSEVHKDSNTGDYTVKHFHKGALVKTVPITGNTDPHAVAKKHLQESADVHYNASAAHVKQAEKHFWSSWTISCF